MQVPFMDLKRQYESIRGEIDAAVMGVVKSANFILGPNVDKLEKDFAAFCGAKYAAGVSSGLDALRITLAGLGVGAGDEVIVPANTFIASALAVSAVGANVALVDNNPDTYNIDIKLLKKAIETGYTKDASKGALVSKRSGKVLKAIMPVHLYGQMADMPQIMELAKSHGLFVVEDACQAHGAWHAGANGEKRRAGSWGDAGCFSFYPSKNLGAYGDGGMIVTSSPELMERIRLLRNYGQRVKYYHDAKGLNTRLDEIQAAVVLAKLPHLDEWNGKRHAVAVKLQSMLAGLPLKLPVEAPSRSHIYHLFVLRLKQRDAMMEHLKSKGVGTIIHYPVPIHIQKAYTDLGYKKGDFPECENCANEILSLPMFAELTDDEVNWMGQAVREFFK